MPESLPRTRSRRRPLCAAPQPTRVTIRGFQGWRHACRRRWQASGWTHGDSGGWCSADRQHTVVEHSAGSRAGSLSRATMDPQKTRPASSCVVQGRPGGTARATMARLYKGSYAGQNTVTMSPCVNKQQTCCTEEQWGSTCRQAVRRASCDGPVHGSLVCCNRLQHISHDAARANRIDLDVVPRQRQRHAPAGHTATFDGLSQQGQSLCQGLPLTVKAGRCQQCARLPCIGLKQRKAEISWCSAQAPGSWRVMQPLLGTEYDCSAHLASSLHRMLASKQTNIVPVA